MLLMTLKEVADYLRVTERTIYRLLWQGSIPAKKVGRQWRFKKASIDEWLSKGPVKLGAHILVIDDEETIRLLFRETLQELGHAVMAADTSSEGVELVKSRNFDLIFLDLKMPGMDGAELFRLIKNVQPKVPVIIITGYPDSEIMARALAQGPFAVMNKPFNESDIIKAVENFLKLTE